MSSRTESRSTPTPRLSVEREYHLVVDHLLSALEEGGEHLPSEEVAAARTVLRRAAQRCAFTGAHTIVALAGATGSGKSSIFNRLVGQDLTTVSARRPTTSDISAAVWGTDPGTDVLDWLGVDQRHTVDESQSPVSEEATLDGLILLDVPDIDSLEQEHRDEADRILALADVFVWVTDPQKYADAVLHDGYLRHYHDHGTVTLVVLNHADRMRSDQAKACRDDLRQLLIQDGLPDAEVFLTSAKTGAGLEEFVQAVSNATQAATAARTRLLADVRHQIESLQNHVAADEAEWDRTQHEELLTQLHHAAGLPSFLDGVEDRVIADTTRVTQWPLSTLSGMKRHEDIRRLSTQLREESEDHDEVLDIIDRSGVGQPTTAAVSELQLAQRDVAQAAAQGLPPAWQDAVDDVMQRHHTELVKALDATVKSSVHQPPRPWWAWLVAATQWMMFIGALCCLGWCAWWLVDPQIPMFMLGPIPYPAIAAVILLVAGDILGQLAASWARGTALRTRRRTERKLRHHFADIAQQYVIEPAGQVREQHRRTRDHLAYSAQVLSASGHGAPPRARPAQGRRRHSQAPATAARSTHPVSSPPTAPIGPSTKA